MTRTALLASLALSAPAVVLAQVGPDMIVSGHVNVGRYGTDAAGAITAYAVGAVSCNGGDEPAIVSSGAIRPHVAQNMYRLKLYTDAPTGATYHRLEHIGQSWAKRVGLPINGTGAGCGACAGSAGTGMMNIGCADTYSSGFNGSQSLLGPRSMCNPALGTSSGGHGSSTGDSITRGRLQVATADVTGQPTGTRFFTENIILLPDDAQHVRPGESIALNGLNNASSQEIDIAGGTGTPVLMGGLPTIVPMVERWRAIDPQVTVRTIDHDDHRNVSPEFPATFIRSRFYVAARVYTLPSNRWRYEYAVFNLNSDRGARALTLPLPAGAIMQDYATRHALSHSGEPYSNAPWPAAHTGDQLTFATTPWLTDPNANAVRWGTTYTFGFTTNVPPSAGTARLTLFKGESTTLDVHGLPVPTLQPCPADFNGDGDINADSDIEAFFACLAGNCCPTCFPARGDYNLDGDTGTDADIEAFFRVLGGGPC